MQLEPERNVNEGRHDEECTTDGDVSRVASARAAGAAAGTSAGRRSRRLCLANAPRRFGRLGGLSVDEKREGQSNGQRKGELHG